MGWFFEEAKYFKDNGEVDVLKEASRGNEDLVAELVDDVVYIAEESMIAGKRTVYALVILTDVTKEDGVYIYGEKLLHEDCGPAATACPENILKLLTPTDSEFANEWRQACWDNIKYKKAYGK